MSKNIRNPFQWSYEPARVRRLILMHGDLNLRQLSLALEFEDGSYDRADARESGPNITLFSLCYLLLQECANRVNDLVTSSQPLRLPGPVASRLFAMRGKGRWHPVLDYTGTAFRTHGRKTIEIPQAFTWFQATKEGKIISQLSGIEILVVGDTRAFRLGRLRNGIPPAPIEEIRRLQARLLRFLK